MPRARRLAHYSLTGDLSRTQMTFLPGVFGAAVTDASPHRLLVPPPDDVTACDPARPLTSTVGGQPVAGAWLLLRRGGCAFLAKVQKAGTRVWSRLCTRSSNGHCYRSSQGPT